MLQSRFISAYQEYVTYIVSWRFVHLFWAQVIRMKRFLSSDVSLKIHSVMELASFVSRRPFMIFLSNFFFTLSSHPASSLPLLSSFFKYVVSSSFEVTFFLFSFLFSYFPPPSCSCCSSQLLFSFFVFFRVHLHLSIHSSISSCSSLFTYLPSPSSTSFPLHSFLFLLLLLLHVHLTFLIVVCHVSCVADTVLC